MQNIVSLVLFFPLVAALLGLIVSKDSIKPFGIVVTGVEFVLTLVLWFSYDINGTGFQLVENIPLIQHFGVSYLVGVDGISLFILVLTGFMTFISMIALNVENNIKNFVTTLLFLETAMIGVFVALDAVLFYLFWEFSLIPMFYIIGAWGAEKRIYAAIKFFIYTFAGSLFMLIGMIYIAYTHYHTTGVLTFSLIEWYKLGFSFDVQYWLFLAFFLGFAIKVPMFPFHTWLPYAHGQAPTIGSVILAAVLLKMGSYGFIRFSLPMFPDATVYFIPMVAILSLIMVVYTAMIAYAQSDMKQVIAYSSVSHMGVVILGTFALNPEGITGSVFLMISHGIVSGALFLLVGVIYDRLHTKDMSKFGGITKVMPLYSIIFGITLMASVGLPLTIGFVGEFLSLLGFYRVSPLMTAIAGTTIILGAIYMLSLFKKSFFGEITNPEVKFLKDLNAREITVFVPIVIVIVVLGIYPKPILEPIDKSSKEIVKFMHSKASTDTKLQIESYNKVGVK
jgi:NADH-quinone oxidoreductase subunit M